MTKRATHLLLLLALGQLCWTPSARSLQDPAAIGQGQDALERTIADLEDDFEPCPDAVRLRVVTDPVLRQARQPGPVASRALETPEWLDPGRNMPLRLGGADGDPDPAAADADHG